MIALQDSPLCPQIAWLLKSFAIPRLLDGVCLFNLRPKQIGNFKEHQPGAL